MKEYLELESHNVSCNKQVMENGETRVRFMSADGSVYIRTEAGESGGWQNSHYHTNLVETYIVQKGWVGFAELIDGRFRLSVETENNIFTANPMVSHNLYLPANAVIHTVKHGRVKQDDWYESEALDALTKPLSEAQIKNSCKKIE